MRTLDALKQAFRDTTTPTGRNSNYYPFYQIPIDSTAVVRFLPDPDLENPLQFLVEKLMHRLEINGNVRSTPCLSMYDEECCVCALAQKYYKAKDEENGKKYYKKRQHLAQVLVVKDPLPPDPETGETHEGKVRVVSLGFQLFGILKNAIESGDLDEMPFSYKGGYNFNIKKVQQGGYPNYTMGSAFARKATNLDDDTVAMIEEEIVELKTLLPKNPGAEKTEALLNAALTGEEYVEPGSTDATSAFTPASKKATVKPAPAVEEVDEGDDDDVPPVVTETKAAPTPAAVDDSDDDGDSSTDDILAKIRSRRKAKAS